LKKEGDGERRDQLTLRVSNDDGAEEGGTPHFFERRERREEGKGRELR